MGRLVSSIAESEWSAIEQGWMVALAQLERITCDGCGGDLTVTLGTEAEDWTVEPPIRCGKCTAVAIRQDNHAKDHKHMHALRWFARLKKPRR